MNFMLQCISWASIWFSNGILLNMNSTGYNVLPFFITTKHQYVEKKDSEGITDMVGNDVKHITDAIGMDASGV